MIYIFTTIPVSTVFFLISIGDSRQKSLRALLSVSLSHTHTHTHTQKCNLSYFPYIAYTVRLNAIQNIRVQNDKNHLFCLHNTKNMAE